MYFWTFCSLFPISRLWHGFIPRLCHLPPPSRCELNSNIQGHSLYRPSSTSARSPLPPCWIQPPRLKIFRSHPTAQRHTISIFPFFAWLFLYLLQQLQPFGLGRSFRFLCCRYVLCHLSHWRYSSSPGLLFLCVLHGGAGLAWWVRNYLHGSDIRINHWMFWPR